MKVNITLPTTITCVARRRRLVERSLLGSEGELPDGVGSDMPGVARSGRAAIAAGKVPAAPRVEQLL
jgi:hypothetical protein